MATFFSELSARNVLLVTLLILLEYVVAVLLNTKSVIESFNGMFAQYLTRSVRVNRPICIFDKFSIYLL